VGATTVFVTGVGNLRLPLVLSFLNILGKDLLKVFKEKYAIFSGFKKLVFVCKHNNMI